MNNKGAFERINLIKKEKMEQLKLTEKELLEIGFEKCKYSGDTMNLPKDYFKISTINGYFYYNTDEDIYTWYHKTIIKKTTNNVLLNINNKSELFTLLSCFKVEFNLIIK